MRRLLKKTVYVVVYLLVLPAGLASKLTHKATGNQIVYHFFSELFSLIPTTPVIAVRACFYKQTLKQCPLDIFIGFGSIISKIDSVIGRGVRIGGNTCVGRVELEDHAAIANDVSVLSGRYQHNFEDPSKWIHETDDRFAKIKIGKNTFIGDRSVIMASVGGYTVVGAGSVVVKEIPDHVVAVGNPARIVKNRK